MNRKYSLFLCISIALLTTQKTHPWVQSYCTFEKTFSNGQKKQIFWAGDNHVAKNKAEEKVEAPQHAIFSNYFNTLLTQPTLNICNLIEIDSERLPYLKDSRPLYKQLSTVIQDKLILHKTTPTSNRNYYCTQQSSTQFHSIDTRPKIINFLVDLFDTEKKRIELLKNKYTTDTMLETFLDLINQLKLQKSIIILLQKDSKDWDTATLNKIWNNNISKLEKSYSYLSDALPRKKRIGYYLITDLQDSTTNSSDYKWQRKKINEHILSFIQHYFDLISLGNIVSNSQRFNRIFLYTGAAHLQRTKKFLKKLGWKVTYKYKRAINDQKKTLLNENDAIYANSFNNMLTKAMNNFLGNLNQ